jgi:hypothetical protein
MANKEKLPEDAIVGMKSREQMKSILESGHTVIYGNRVIRSEADLPSPIELGVNNPALGARTLEEIEQQEALLAEQKKAIIAGQKEAEKAQEEADKQQQELQRQLDEEAAQVELVEARSALNAEGLDDASRKEAQARVKAAEAKVKSLQA